MRSDSARWREVTPSEFPHECEGLEHVRELLPDRPPYRAWSNFEFRDSGGRWHEVDLLVLGERRLHLVELKHYRGMITGSAYRWQRGGRSSETPLLLAERKAKRLRDVIQRRLRELAPDLDPSGVPFIQQCVFLHARDGRCALPPNDRTDLFGRDDIGPNRSGLPSIATRLLEPASGRPAALIGQDDILASLFDNIGFTLRREREVGSWRLTGEALAEGDGWQDWPAEHKLAHRDTVRIRFHVSQPGLSQSDLVSHRQLVQRQYDLTRGLQHEGLLKPRDLVDDDLGIGLVYDRNDDWQPLDLWLADHPGRLSVDKQVALIRQLAEALDYAHHNHVVHRGLCPRAITVDGGSGELRVKLSDWQVAGLDDPALASHPTQGAATRLLKLLDENAVTDPDRLQAEAYAAPEGRWDPTADRVRLDVFALGAVTYHLVAGRAPATDAGELRDRVVRESGLDLAGDLSEVPSALRKLVLDATKPAVSERLADVAGFLTELDQVERELTVPGDEVETDPLEAPPGTLLGGRFELVRRLGSGSTAVGLLVADREAKGEERVLKVALDDSAARRLAHEAEMLTALRGRSHPRLVQLVAGHVITVGERSALLLESAGAQTLADVLHERPRLSLDLLDRWGTDLLEALVDLDRAGIDHRDIKPANLGVREQRGDRAKHLVLFDFSLARAAADSVDVGTPQYRDPFLGSGSRLRWDSAAERYAAAATLHEMAAGHVPWFGDRRSDPAAISDEATIESDWFDLSVAEELVAFFRQALRRDASQRHDTAAEMLAAWRTIFTTKTTTVPGDADRIVAEATPDTPLQNAGLSARALSAIEQFDAATVADLVRVDPGQLSRMAGVAAPTRTEVRSRAKQWRERFVDVVGRSADTGPAAAEGPLADPTAAATMLVAAAGPHRAGKRRHAAEVLLGLAGDVDPFGTLAQLAPALSVASTAAVSISLGTVHDAWAANAEARDFLDGVSGLAADALGGLGGLATAGSVVAELARRTEHGGEPEPGAARVVAGLLRAALDRMDNIERGGGAEATIVKRRRRRDGRVLLASTPELLDAAEPLAAAAEDLVAAAAAVGDELVPTGRSEPVLRRLWPRSAPVIDGVRLARTVARLSERVGASRRGELHARDLAPAAAVKRALGGLASAERLTVEDLRARVRARFPDLADLPGRPRVDQLLVDAGVELRWDGDRFAVPSRPLPSSRLASRSDIPILLAPPGARRTEDVRLTRSMQERSFLTLGVRGDWYDGCREALVARYGVAVVDVTGVLIEALRAQAEAAGIPWDDVRAADAESPRGRLGKGLRALVDRSLPALDRAIQDAIDGSGGLTRPVLLVEAAPLARYGHTELLARLADITAGKGQAVWLLIPAATDAPMLDGAPVPLAHSGQYLPLDAWMRGPVTEGAPA